MLEIYFVDANGIFTALVATTAERITKDLRQRFFTNLITPPLDEQPSEQLGRIASEFVSCKWGQTPLKLLILLRTSLAFGVA